MASEMFLSTGQKTVGGGLHPPPLGPSRVQIAFIYQSGSEIVGNQLGTYFRPGGGGQGQHQLRVS